MGVWHAPLILLGYDYPGLPPVLALGFMIVITTLLAGLLDWLRTASGNVCVTGLAHGAVNAAAGIALLFSAAGAPPNSASTGLLGWSGWFVLAAALMVVAVLQRRRRHRRTGSDTDVPGVPI